MEIMLMIIPIAILISNVIGIMIGTADIGTNSFDIGNFSIVKEENKK